MSLTEPIPNPELQNAGVLYGEGPVLYVGNFVMARETARSMPIDLVETYEPAVDALASDRDKAIKFAQRFGKLSINVALDGAPTSFTLQPNNSYTQPDTAPIKTVAKYLPSNMFRAEEQDAKYSYLIFDETPMTVELGLIQALHMLDYAIVSDQFDGKMPLFRAIDYDQLAKLQSKHSDVFVRTYGNVRGLAEAPQILGTVIPTAILEKSGLELPGFEAAASADTLRAVALSPQRESAVVVGITTAKRPHIGHGFLLTKAIAEAGEQGQVIVELNDLGPRVARAVSALASQLGITVEQTLEAIMHAEVAPSALETAYKSRANFDETDLPPDFALTANNAVYERLLAQFSPETSTITPIANSSRAMKGLLSTLFKNPAAQPLFGNKDMVLLGKEKATVIAQYGKPTMAGIIGALASGYQVNMVDSPLPLDRNQAQIFEAAAIPIQQTEGIGLSIGFGVASGTGGEAPSLQAFLSSLGPEATVLAPKILRVVLNEAVFVQGNGKSLNPNYASSRVLLQKLQAALNIDPVEVDIYKPFEFKKITREVAKSLTPYDEEGGLANKGKITPAEISQLINSLPAISGYLSSRLMNFSLESPVVPKNMISQRDANILNKIRTADPQTIFSLTRQSLVANPDMIQALADTKLAVVMAKMGYDLADALVFLELLEKAGDVYVLV